MSGPFHSPAPWSVNASGGAATIVARDRSVVAVIVGGGDAAPFEAGNGAVIAAAPELVEALRDLFRMVEEGTLVRNVARDAEPGWAAQAMKLVMVLKHADAALAKVGGR